MLNIVWKLASVMAILACMVSCMAKTDHDSAVLQVLRDFQVVEEGKGDLDGDGIHVAAIIRRGSGANEEVRLVILHGRVGTYEVWERTRNLGFFRKGDLEVEIERGSVFVHWLSGTCCAVSLKPISSLIEMATFA